MTRRVAVTGIGVISALGRSRGEFWDALKSARCGIGPMTLVPAGSVRFENGAEVPDYRAADYFEEKEAAMLDRFAQFALIAAREAVADSGIAFDDALGEASAVVTGSCLGGKTTEDEGFRGLYELKSTRFPPLSIPKAMANAGASRISLEYGIRGPVYTISTACSSANHAIGQAFWMVRGGVVEAAIAGGSEAPFSLGVLKAWEAMRVVSPDTCRPFSKDRRGLILGEGAAMLVLESLERARARGARVYGEIAGFGMSSDAFHLTQPLAAGAARAMRAALYDARIEGPAIGYVNAHGTGTPANDPAEVEAIRAVCGDRVLVSSTKSMHGHALGAAGAIEAAATLLALDNELIPPTANFTEADPACNLDVVPNIARTAAVEWALSNSFAFGGLNAALVFRRL
ncbi:MAG TPA: beta-ketoacyl-[acyl-carrier-protein] synthase family protein [Bryobacteraceae bacterium]|jgi:nodulation protein E|nr:beta-ketoacyl-[acyl-carrier-protein] synthase family protein [Bryobacteraceae bacterium]